MVGSVTDVPSVNWCVPLSFAKATGIVFLGLMAYSPYGFLWIFLIAPIVCIAFLMLLVIAAIEKKKRQCLSAFLGLAAFVSVSAPLVVHRDDLRASVRWWLWSRHFKNEVLAQPAPGNGDLRHMEWEATGFAGVANETVYLVFDPRDSLSGAATSHEPIKIVGIPCKVPHVRRLESHWYSVWFYADEVWGWCTQG
jgi:hypothetical protein